MAPHADDLRDLVAHLDAYPVGEGWRQRSGHARPIAEKHLERFIYWPDDGGTMLRLGDHEMDLRAASSAAVEPAYVVERVRERHIERVEREANAALRRRYGLRPE